MKGEFYKMDYEAWDEGTDELSLEQEAAYLRLCHQLYRRKAAIPSAPATLARIWRCHPNKARKLLADLVTLGKVTERDGHLTNTRVTRELDDREIKRTQKVDAGHTGGTRTQENRRKSLNSNVADEASAETPAKQNQAEREKEGEGEKKEPRDPNGSPAPRGAVTVACRVPDGFENSEAARKIAAEFGYVGAEIDDVLGEFVDYWRPLPKTKAATKLDWPATLRNRLRDLRRRAPPAGRPPPPGRGNGFGHLAAQKRAARQTEDGDGNATQHHADRSVRPPQSGAAGSPEDDARGGYGDGPGQILDLVARRAYG